MRREEKHSPAIAKALDDFYKSDKRIRGLSSDEENNSEKLRDVLSEKVKEDIVDLVRKNSEFIKNINIRRKSPINENEENLEINHFSTYSRAFYRNFIGLPNLEHFFEETKDAVNCIDSLVRLIDFGENNDPYEITLNNIFSILSYKIHKESSSSFENYIVFIKIFGLICRKIVVCQCGKNNIKICMNVGRESQTDMFVSMFFNALGVVERCDFPKIVEMFDYIFDSFYVHSPRHYLLEDYMNPISNTLDTICYQYDNQMANLVEYHENKEY